MLEGCGEGSGGQSWAGQGSPGSAGYGGSGGCSRSSMRLAMYVPYTLGCVASPVPGQNAKGTQVVSVLPASSCLRILEHRNMSVVSATYSTYHTLGIVLE